MFFLDIVSSILLIAGVFFGLSGAIGLFKFPDFFTRVHAASVTDSVAALLIIGGLLLQTSFDLNTAKLLFILLFLMITSPYGVSCIGEVRPPWWFTYDGRIKEKL